MTVSALIGAKESTRRLLDFYRLTEREGERGDSGGREEVPDEVRRGSETLTGRHNIEAK